MSRYYYTEWNTDSNGNKKLEHIQNESHKIVNNKFFLDQVPDGWYKVKINNMFEVTSVASVANETQFKVNYDNGEITLHPNLEGSDIIVAEYYGVGLIKISSKRIVFENDGSTIVATDIDGAIKEQNSRIDNLVSQTGESNTEIVDGRNSSVKNTTYTTLKNRLDASETDVENISDEIVTARKGEVDLVTKINTIDLEIDAHSSQLQDHSSQLSDIAINVKSFGAKGDGITDDTSVILNACAYLDSIGGGTLFFPLGNYVVSTLLFDTASNIKLFSFGAVIKNTTEQINSVIRILNSSNIIIDGLKIQGTGNTISIPNGYSYHGIYVNNCNNITIKNCEIHDMSSGGIMVIESTMVRINDNYLHDNLSMFDIAFGYSQAIINLDECWICGNRCESNNYYGVYVQGHGNKVTISDNHIKTKREYGIMVYRFNNPSSYKWKDVIVSDNIIEDVSENSDPGHDTYYGGMGIYLQNVEKLIVSNNIVRDVLKNRTDASSPNRTLPPGAISINSSTEVTCTGNMIDGSGIDGIDISNVEGISRGTTVSDNVVLSCERSGIRVVSAQNIIINGNMVEGTSSKVDVGIVINSSSTQPTKNIIVCNNRINGGFANGISVDKGTGTNVVGVSIKGNYVQDIVYSYVTVSDADDIVVNNNIIKNVLSSQTVGNYGILLTRVNNFACNGNLLKGESGFELSRGLAVTTGTKGVVSNNTIVGINDVYYSLYMLSNTDVYCYGNFNPRQKMPMIGEHTIGINPSENTSVRVLYRTSIPDASIGYCEKGSICHNLDATAGGFAGWICVATGTPGTWKTFGVISS